MAFDHGILNIPLAKRGNIDKQIDAYKAEQARAAKAKDKVRRTAHDALLADAKALIEQVSDARMAELGKPHGLTIKQVRAQFLSAASVNPERVAKAMQRELLPKAGA